MRRFFVHKPEGSEKMEPLAMLRNMHETIKEEGKDDRTAFEELVMWVANQYSLAPSPVLKEETFDRLKSIWDPEVLHRETWDWLGELLDELNLEGVSVLPREQAEEYMREFGDHLRQHRLHPGPTPICDTQLGSGRKMLLLFQTFDRDLLYMGLEKDLLLYRIALVNYAIYNIPGCVLHADGDVHEWALHSQNWRYAGYWNPKDWKNLRKQRRSFEDLLNRNMERYRETIEGLQAR